MNSKTIISNLDKTTFSSYVKYRAYFGSDMTDCQIAVNTMHPIIAFRMRSGAKGAGCTESDILDFVLTSLQSRMTNETDKRQMSILANAIESLTDAIGVMQGYREE